jgi:hypothetical protein
MNEPYPMLAREEQAFLDGTRTLIIFGQAPCAQQLRQPVGVDPVAFVAGPAPPARVADDHTLGMPGEHVVQPLRLRPFFEDDVRRAAIA